MNIAGKFARVDSYKADDSIVVGLLGNVWPADLTEDNIRHIKAFYNMPADSTHEFYNEWPHKFQPMYWREKGRYHAFMLIKR